MVPLFGDMRLIRNDIIHNRGIASRNKSGRCEVLKWFVEGEVIRIASHHIDDFVRKFRSTPFELP